MLPDFVQSWPAVSEKSVKLIKQQALETSLLVASVQAAGVYVADQLEDAQERDRGSVPGEKGALTKPESTARKAIADRKQFRQNLRVSRYIVTSSLADAHFFALSNRSAGISGDLLATTKRRHLTNLRCLQPISPRAGR